MLLKMPLLIILKKIKRKKKNKNFFLFLNTKIEKSLDIDYLDSIMEVH